MRSKYARYRNFWMCITCVTLGIFIWAGVYAHFGVVILAELATLGSVICAFHCDNIHLEERIHLRHDRLTSEIHPINTYSHVRLDGQILDINPIVNQSLTWNGQDWVYQGWLPTSSPSVDVHVAPVIQEKKPKAIENTGERVILFDD